MKKIEKFHPDLDGIRWVASAINKKVTNPALQHLLFTGKTFVGCDRHRMHTYKPHNKDDFEIGLYEIVKNTKTMIHLVKPDEITADQYPNWKIVFPKGKGKRIPVQKDKSNCAWAIKDILCNLEETVNPLFVIDALETGETFTAHIHKDGKPIMLTNRRHTAALMPCRH